MKNTGGIRRDGSAACDLCYVAHVKFDLFWELNLSLWDIAAGELMVREAGGCVTDLSGRGDHARKRQIVASNHRVHGEFLELAGRHQGRVRS